MHESSPGVSTATRFISIVMPVRNAAASLPRALDSVAREFAGIPHEIVIADGASTDGSVACIEAHPTRPRLVSTSDHSLYDGLNKAIAAAHGDWVLWLNADDEVSRGVSALCSVAQAGRAAMVTGEAQMLRDSVPAWTSDNHRNALTPERVLFAIPTINTRLFRKEALRRVGPFSADIGLAADREFLLRAGRVLADRVAINEVVYKYHAGAGSRTMAGDWASYLRVHTANLELAAMLETSLHGTEPGLVSTYRQLSHAAVTRAGRMTGGGMREAAMNFARSVARPIDLVSGIRSHVRYRRQASGW
ncbi:MAG: glycosyltransferase [Pseudomonadota bacterium]